MSTGIELVEDIRAGRATPPSGITTLGLDRTHEWLTVVESGHVVLEWPVDTDHSNLEGAVISVWLTALADQTLFFATQTVCGPGEGTRMASLQLDCIENVTEGTLTVDGRVDQRSADRLHCTCEMRRDDGVLAARVTAVIDVIR